MQTQMQQPIIPANKHGRPVDLSYSCTEESADEAINTYKRCCARLQNPRIWKQVAGAFSASFELYEDANGDPHRLLQLHDYLRIDIPGPGPSAGDGYDWVQVEAVEENLEQAVDESFGIRLRSSTNPGKPMAGTAHFFSSAATSVFLITRHKNTITVSYHGRNEIPNSRDAGNLDSIRNRVVAAGAIAGISEMQWSALIKGLAAKEIGA